MITIYSKPNCHRCNLCKKKLDFLNIPYIEIDISNNNQLRRWLLAKGLRTVPQLFYNDTLFVKDGWDGLDRLNQRQIQERIKDVSKQIL